MLIEARLSPEVESNCSRPHLAPALQINLSEPDIADRSSQEEPKGVESSMEQSPSKPAGAEASGEHDEEPSRSRDAQVKKKSKRTKVKSALGIKPDDEGSSSAGGDHGSDKKVSEALVDKILDQNTAIEGDGEHERRRNVEEMLKKGDVAELLTGLVRCDRAFGVNVSS